MRKTLWLPILAALVLFTGCSRYLRTKDLRFYKDADTRDGGAVYVDVVYPKDIDERDEIYSKFKKQPLEWFKNDSRYSDFNVEKADVKNNNKVVPVNAGVPKNVGVLVFAEFGQRVQGGKGGSRADQVPILAIHEGSKPPPHKTEYIWIGPGFLERREKRPSILDQ